MVRLVKLGRIWHQSLHSALLSKVPRSTFGSPRYYSSSLLFNPLQRGTIASPSPYRVSRILFSSSAVPPNFDKNTPMERISEINGLIHAELV